MPVAACGRTDPVLPAPDLAIEPGCSDGKKNFAETAVDCGGEGCFLCADSDACVKDGDSANAACSGGNGSAGTCAADDRCADGARNGNETGVDCGGSCPGCPTAMRCNVDGDCFSKACATFVVFSEKTWRQSLKGTDTWWDVA